MNKIFRNTLVVILGIGIISCSKVPITGRKQLKLLPNSMMMAMGQSNYATFLQENPAVSPPTMQSAEVTEVGTRISQAVEKYMKDNGLSKKIAGYKWEFNVVDSKDVNAWCMPGGKVVVYTGILPITKDAAGLAVVLGHEIAHAIADHGNERMSQELAVQAAGIGLEIYMQQKPQQTHDIFMSAFGVGSQLGILGFSRQHELEADKLGLVFMAMAGYNPERAVTFWQEMAKTGGTKPLEILSTHPSDERRINQIQSFLPEAKKYYSENPVNPSPSGNQKITPVKPGTATPQTPQTPETPKKPVVKISKK
jgi:predicted Zn-dependent protease